jgi:hypothetical protein
MSVLSLFPSLQGGSLLPFFASVTVDAFAILVDTAAFPVETVAAPVATVAVPVDAVHDFRDPTAPLDDFRDPTALTGLSTASK